MYCSDCGVKATGKFCHNCGSLLHVADAALDVQREEIAPSKCKLGRRSPIRNIVTVDAVRKVISRHAENAPKIVSGEAILAVYDKVVSSPIPLEKLAAIVQPLYDSWGIRTGKNALNCSMPRSAAPSLGHSVHWRGWAETDERRTARSRMYPECRVAVFSCALKGTVSISLQSRELWTHVIATTTIPGQLYDWGKSNRCLEHLFNDIRSELGLPRNVVTPESPDHAGDSVNGG